MSHERMKCLVNEYRLVEKRLDEAKGEYIKLKAGSDISQEVQRDLSNEVIRGREVKDEAAIQFWQDILDKHFQNDKDLPTSADLKNAQEKISGENEKLIVYYERKLQAIKKLLGYREAELFETFAEKNILMGGGSSSKREIYDEIEEEERKKHEKDKGSFNFDKM